MLIIQGEWFDVYLKTALDDFYEEELNWWDREHEEGEEL